MTDALAQLAELSSELRYASEDLVAQAEAMAMELERQPVRLSLWARIFGIGP